MIELQRKLIGDRIRNDAFHEALQSVVKQGDEVIDLGSGTGFLAFLCSKLGAKHISCIESGEIVRTAKKLAERNGIKNCTFIARHSTNVKELPKADVLVSETLGNYALEENIIESVEDAKRFLKKDAVILPHAIRQYVCPVTGPRIHRDIDVWDAGFNLRFDEARDISLNNIYVKTFAPDDLLAKGDAAQCWDTVDFSNKNPSVREGKVSWQMDTECTVTGLALWWEADLAKDITLSTSPLAPATHWEQIYLPLLQPIELKKGERLDLVLHSDTRWHVKINLRWNVTHVDASGKKGATQSLDMRKGYLN